MIYDNQYKTNIRQTAPDATIERTSSPTILKTILDTAAIRTNKYPDQAQALFRRK